MKAHDVARCLVQDQGEAIELHYPMEPTGQLVEQRGQIAVQDNRFRNGQQGSVQVGHGGFLPLEGCNFHCENLGQSLIRNQEVVQYTSGCS